MFSQLSQSSLDEVLTNEQVGSHFRLVIYFLIFFFEVIVLFYWFFIFYLQRVSSQERENTVKKFSCLPPGSYTREDSQTPIRCSTNVVRKWNPASAPDQRCKLPHCGMIRHF